MKILMVTEFFPTGKDLRFSGGVEARTYFVAKDLAKKHQVSIICSRQEGSKSQEKTSGINIYRVGPIRPYEATIGSISKRINFIKEAIKTSKNLKPDIVDGSNYISHFIAKTIANSQNIPAVAWYPDVWIGSWIKNVGVVGIIGEILERINVLRDFDAYIAISRETAKKLAKHTTKKIDIIYCGVDKNEFSQKTKKALPNTIISIARLTKYKNVSTTLYAFAHLSIKVKKVRLVIVGTGPELHRLKELSRSLKIDGKVKFISNLPRKQLVSQIKSSKVFSLASTVEGFGIATVEAAAAGTPYVISNIAINREITKNGFGGFLVESHNPVEFSAKFQNLLEEPHLYQQKVKECLSLSKNYDWAKIALQTEKVYKRLV